VLTVAHGMNRRSARHRHFVEHMLFKGRRLARGGHPQAIDSIAGSSTVHRKEYASYYIKVLRASAARHGHPLDIVRNPAFSRKISSGKKVVVEEIKMSRTRPTTSSEPSRKAWKTSARPADSRHARNVESFTADSLRCTSPTLTQELHSAVGNIEHHGCASWSRKVGSLVRSASRWRRRRRVVPKR